MHYLASRWTDLQAEYAELRSWRFQIGSAEVRAGCCSPQRRTVEVSRWVVEVDEEEAIDTLLHEAAHALAWARHSVRGHGPSWKTLALELGARPKRCYHRDLGAKRPLAPLVLRCSGCGTTWPRHRRSSVRGRYHADCGPSSRLTFERS